MIDRFASRVSAAQSRAGIATFIPDARLIKGAFGTDGAFRATIWRTAQEGR